MKVDNNIYKDQEFTYYTDRTRECDSCFNIINNIIFIKVYWDKHSFIKYYCFNCKDLQKFQAKIVEEFKAIIVDTPPPEANLYIMVRPSLREGNISSFDINSIEKLGGSTTDKTLYSGRESFEGVSIGDPLIISKLEEKDHKLLSIDEGLNLLDDLFKSKVMIEDQSEEVKKLEDKKGGKNEN